MFTEWIGNPFTHTLLLSPLMGVFFGALFSGLTKSPTESMPRTLIETREVYRERVIYREKSNNSSSDDGRGLLVVFGIGMLMLVWQYAIWAELIHLYIEVTLLTVIGFSTTTTLMSLFKGQFTSEEWWIYVVFPLVVLMLSMYLLYEAKSRFDPELTQLAIDNTWWHFYTKSLFDYGRKFIIFHVMGVVLLSALVLVTSIIQLHYLALMNHRGLGRMRGFWFFLVRITDALSGRTGLIVSVILLVMTFLLINDHIAHWASN